MEYNSKEAILKWMNNSLENSDLTDEQDELLRKIGLQEIDKGGLRGDVCNKWRDAGFGSGDIFDFYP